MRRAWPLGLLLLVGVVGWLAVEASAPGLHGGDLWPVGLASGVLLLAGRRAWAYLPPLAALAGAGFWAAGRPLDVSVASALAIAAEVTVIWLVLTSSGRERPRLRSFADLDRYAAAAVLGAATAATVTAVATTVTGFGDPPLVALAVGASHLSSQLVVLPFFLHPAVEEPSAGTGERVLAWGSVLAVTPLVFVVGDLPALGFLVMPLLVWSALRLGTWLSLAQVAAVALIASVLHLLGYGPPQWVPLRVEDRADAAVVLLQLFVVGCALVVIPLVLMASLRRTADREASSERDKLASVVRAARGVAIIGTDREGRVTLFNPGAERLLGYRRADVLGRRASIFHSTDAIRRKAEELGVEPDHVAVTRALVDPANDRTLHSFLRSDGRERAHLLTLAEIVDERGRVTGYVSTSEDVTEQVETQQALERALGRMKEVDALKDALRLDRQPRAPHPGDQHRGLPRDARRRPVRRALRAQRDAVGRVQSNSGRLLTLVDDLLTLARMRDEPAAEDERVPVALGEVVRSCWALVTPQAQQSGVRLVPRAVEDGHDPDGPVVLGDRQALEGVLINLLGNAVKFTPSGGEVEVRLDRDGDQAVLLVCDTGIGIPEDEVELLFTRFFRSSVTRDAAIPGSGLGLAIVQGVVTRHGGSIEVASQVGRGTTVTVRLPLAPSRR